MKSSNKICSYIVAIVATILFCAWGITRLVCYWQFNINCTQYLKRAADASTIETAKEELGKAISYVEEKGLTEGVVSIFMKQPRNDLGYWYKNMTEAYSELDELPETVTSLEQSNVLMKLRETLTDEKDDGISVTVPDGISIYPHNVSFFWWCLLSGLIFCIMWAKILVDLGYY